MRAEGCPWNASTCRLAATLDKTQRIHNHKKQQAAGQQQQQEEEEEEEEPQEQRRRWAGLGVTKLDKQSEFQTGKSLATRPRES